MSGGSKQRENYLREIQILKSVKHENLIAIHDEEIKQFEINIVMEYCPRNLYDYLQK
jgi:serine/threonine protein kinase